MSQEPKISGFAERWLLRDEIGIAIPDSFDIEIAESFLAEDSPNLSAENDDRRPVTEWSDTLNLIEAASAALSDSEARVDELQAQLDLERTVSQEELQAMHAQLTLARNEITRAYGDAARANKRATEAEAWLSRLSAAAHNGFSHISEDSRLRRMHRD